MIRPIGIITARAGSKRLPGKNAVYLGDKPLIAWTIEAALKSKCLKRVIISTEDKKIAKLCEKYGAEVPFLRPTALAQDRSTHVSVFQHDLGWLERHGQAYEYFVLLQPTSPFRTSGDIDAACRLAGQKNAAGVVSVCEATRFPLAAMAIGLDGRIKNNPLPKLYVPNGAIYLNKTEAFLREKSFYPRKTFPYLMPLERSVDIDTRLDFQWAQFLLKRALL